MDVKQLQNQKRVEEAVKAMKERSVKVERINKAVNQMKENSDKKEDKNSAA